MARKVPLMLTMEDAQALHNFLDDARNLYFRNARNATRVEMVNHWNRWRTDAAAMQDRLALSMAATAMRDADDQAVEPPVVKVVTEATQFEPPVVKFVTEATPLDDEVQRRMMRAAEQFSRINRKD